MASGGYGFLRNQIPMLGLVILLIGQSLVPFAIGDDSSPMPSTGRDVEVWTDGGVHWPQFARTPGHEAIVPAHSPSVPGPDELLSITAVSYTHLTLPTKLEV